MPKAIDLDSNRHLTMPLVPKSWASIVKVKCHLAYLDKFPSTVSCIPPSFPQSMPPPLSPPLHLLERQKDIKLVLSSKALIDSALHNYFSSFWNGPVAWKRVELKNTEDRWQ